jgi:hypothetical protein
MIIRAMDGNKVSLFPDDHFSLKILRNEKTQKQYLHLCIRLPEIVVLNLHFSEDAEELNYLSDMLIAKLLAKGEIFNVRVELKFLDGLKNGEGSKPENQRS